MPSVECSAPCVYRSYNKYRKLKFDSTYELSTLPGAIGPKGTCQHGTMIKIDGVRLLFKGNIIPMCRSFEHWDTLSQKAPNAKSRGGVTESE